MGNDDTQHPKNQEHYAHLERQYRKLFQAVECSPVSVIITDALGKIEYINPKFSEITGYSAAEIVGRNPRILKSGRTKAEVFRNMWETITAGKEWRGEFINRKKNGDLYYEYAAISAVSDENGKITNFVAVKQDITAQKHAEQEKEKAHGFLQMVIDAIPEGVMVIGRDYRIKLMNKAIRDSIKSTTDKPELYCYQASHHQDTPCSGDSHPCPLLTVSTRSQTVSMLHKHYTEAGEMRYVELVAVPLFDANGVFDGIIESGRDITTRKLSEEKLEYLAHYDPLTDIPNRVIFFEKLQQTITTAKQENSKFAILYIDLDGFKAVNDTLGHEVGDLLLSNAAKRLSGSIRHADTVARMGGDEFAIILAPLKERHNAVMISQKIQLRLSEVFRLGAHACTVGASVGISFYPDDGDSPEALLKQADEAMYNNKRTRKKTSAEHLPVRGDEP